jgi:hypothetical protein
LAHAHASGWSRRHLFTAIAALGAVLTTLALAGTARATELVYWNNYSATPATIAFASIDGSGGGTLSMAGLTGPNPIDNPEGMAYDSVTNRIYVASEGNDQILFVNADGTGAGLLPTGSAPVSSPEGVTVDPATQTVYWLNTGTSPDSIGWAKIDGSSAGTLSTAGATIEGPYRIALDPVAGRIYWGNTTTGKEGISYASTNNPGGGNLNVTGAPPISDVSGIAVDNLTGRIYWLNTDHVSFASLAGGGGGQLNLTGAEFDSPYGLSVVDATGKIYWANYNHKTTERANALGFGNLLGGGGGISIATAELNGPQDPLILRSPTGTAAPTIAKAAKTPSQLSCSTGSWAADLPGAFVYQTPRALAYQWTLKGAPVAGATGVSLTATKPGSYACVVTATNQAGSAAQTSAAVKVAAPKIKLTVKKKAKASPGGLATFPIKALNQGDLKSGKARVCVKLTNQAKQALKAPKCKSLGKVKGRGKDAVKVKIKVLPTAATGTYKVTFQVKGSPGKPAQAKVLVK